MRIMEKKCIKISNIKISPDKNTAFLEGIIKKELRLGKMHRLIMR